MLHDVQLQPYREFNRLMEGCCRPYRLSLVNVPVDVLEQLSVGDV
jgi:hypothetical protein